MMNPLQITLRDIRRTEALESRIRRAVQKLERHSAILGCRIVVDSPHHHHRHGRQFVVHLDLKVPAGDIVVNRDHHENLYVALQRAFAAAERQLEGYARRRRGEPRSHRGSAWST